MLDVIELAQRLVRTPSPVVPGDERAVSELVQAALVEAGLPAAEVIARSPERPNLLTTIDFGSGGSHLVLSGHLDTKPVGEAVWTVDPYAADIDGDRLYGLGSADMKAAIAAMITAVHQLTSGSALERGRVSLLFTADEEAGAEYGAKYLSQTRDIGGDALIIGEPGGIHSDFDSLHLVSRGLGRFVVTAHGEQGHSSLSSLLGKRNAGADLADALSVLRRDLDVTIPDNADGLRDWTATVNPAMVYRGGYGYGVLPQYMSATVEVRTLPGMTDGRLLAELRTVIDSFCHESGARVTVDYDNSPAHWIDATAVASTNPIVEAIERVSADVLGATVPRAVFPGTTDTSWFAPSGLPSLPALGPGLLTRAHGADEWVSVAAVRTSVNLYRRILEEFCGRPSRDDGEPES